MEGAMPVIKIKVERALLQDRVRCLADDFFQVSRPIVLSGRGWVPAVDIYEGPDAVYVVADTAGADKESLHLIFKGQFLHLAGRRRPPVSLDNRRFYQMEIEYGPFERIIRIPVAVDTEQMEAYYENGLLVIQMLRKKANNTIKIDVS
ncbi:MAG: Hsp20/alpha crystallin family protein [Deltaproteobacteria bacterium]|nr:MAG: Hsp20/alpha crystallin family protein [Deltaproteobacteria bacterium]RKX58949.1 MAG: Hsp20/alpha crystallin family protein [Thermodesulfobacteriota bacterium]